MVSTGWFLFVASAAFASFCKAPIEYVTRAEEQTSDYFYQVKWRKKRKMIVRIVRSVFFFSVVYCKENSLLELERTTSFSLSATSYCFVRSSRFETTPASCPQREVAPAWIPQAGHVTRDISARPPQPLLSWEHDRHQNHQFAE